MEQQSIRTQPPGPRRRPPSGADRAAVPSPAAPVDSRLRSASGGMPVRRARLPWAGRDRERTGRPARLTAVGAGVAAVAGTLLVAGVDRMLFGGLGVLFGLGYVVVCFQLAVRVRYPDLPAAPIAGPIAFALALALLQPVGTSGVTGRVVALASGLAVRAAWLFAGTGLAAVIVAARFVAKRRIRRAR
ncbi:DUF6542 domain-containing protein [Kitasatospora sp. DSM 101779]|uniref:DUF6542 domain-containing protein n=1 Tax=Kitasatospora sp. DSM 101779 TaxID=2853165 RepID=UPI0021D99074|nr:DUF6542 domain-containing protein [Kitasatospora sp. DSM 101779]MCU7823049.1 hypothetical protein [Kitasatospora sp. DSM 101779]